MYSSIEISKIFIPREGIERRNIHFQINEYKHEYHHDHDHGNAIGHTRATAQKIFDIIEQCRNWPLRLHMAGNVVKPHEEHAQKHEGTRQQEKTPGQQ